MDPVKPKGALPVEEAAEREEAARPERRDPERQEGERRGAGESAEDAREEEGYSQPESSAQKGPEPARR